MRILKDFYFNKDAGSLHFIFENGRKGQPLFSKKEALLAFWVLRFRGDISPNNFSSMIEMFILSIELLPFCVGEIECMINYLETLKQRGFINQDEFNLFKKGFQFLKETSKVGILVF